MRLSCVSVCTIGLAGVALSMAYQYVLGYHPCQYCLALRILYGATLLTGVAGFFVNKRLFSASTASLAILIILFSWMAGAMECCMAFVPTLMGTRLSVWSMAGGLALLLIATHSTLASRPHPRS